MRSKKILFLAAQISIHARRWANAMDEQGYEIHFVTQHSSSHGMNDSVTVHYLPYQGIKGYFINYFSLRRLINDIKPDLLHASYATGYGTLARLVGFRPYLLSVWGSDVFLFPKKSIFHRWFLKGNLQAADHLCSTSKAMRFEVESICSDLKKVDITPFGVDVNKFLSKGLSQKDKALFTIGTIKTLSHIYGIDTLIIGFSKLVETMRLENIKQAESLRLLIVGGGPQRAYLESLAENLGVSELVEFTGEIEHSNIAEYYNKLDVFVAVSRSESFGVSVLEASASALPVIVSDVGGLPEVVVHGKTGFIIPADAPEDLASTLAKMIQDMPALKRMGEEGRNFVNTRFSWGHSVEIMKEVYGKLI